MSRNLVHLARDLWMWYLKKNIHLTPQHLPGVENVIADAESRNMRDRSVWQLDPAIFRQIAHRFGPIDVDLFALRLNHTVPSLLQLVARSLFSSNECIPTGLVWLCKPSLEPDREDPIQGTSRHDQDSTGSRSLKDSAMVPTTSPTANSRTPADNTQSASGAGQLSKGYNPSTRSSFRSYNRSCKLLGPITQ